MSEIKNTLSNGFRSIKDQTVNHFKNTWSAFERTPGNSLVKDTFTNKENLKKLGFRIAHIALGLILGLQGLVIGGAIVAALPTTVTVLSFLALGALATGLTGAIFSKQIKGLIDKVLQHMHKPKTA